MHAMEACTGSNGVILHVLNFGSSWICVRSTSHPGCFSSQESLTKLKFVNAFSCIVYSNIAAM